MELKIYSSIQDDYQKINKTVEYFSQKIFQKFPLKQGWSLKVWLNPLKSKKGEKKCGVQLNRPRRPSVYVGRQGQTPGSAARDAFETLEVLLLKEQTRSRKQ